MEENTKKYIIAAVIIIAVSMVSLNIGFTGKSTRDLLPASDTPKFLNIDRIGALITVELDYGYDKYSDADHTIYMEGLSGIKTVYTKCDPDYGYRARGTGDCVREIAVFDVSGDDYPRSRRTFSVKNTNVKETISI